MITVQQYYQTKPSDVNIIEANAIQQQLIAVGYTSLIFLFKKKFENQSENVLIIKKFNELGKRFLPSEVDAIRSLNHKNIIKLTDYIDDILIFPFYKNGELFDYIYVQQFPQQLVRYYFIQLASAIQYMHQQHFVHRDIKLQNVLLDNDYNLILIDFGFAVNLGNKGTYITGSAGTRGIISPQQEKKKSYNGYKNDIFALGILLFQLSFQKSPFEVTRKSDKNFKMFIKDQLSNKIFWNQIAIWTGKVIDPSLIDLINHMLEYKENKRYDIQQVLNHSWMSGPTFTFEQAREFMQLTRIKIEQYKSYSLTLCTI